MPTPITPSSPGSNYALSGSGWVTSGNTMTSGTPVQHAEYRQWVTIDYHRKPDQWGTQMDSQNQYWDLSIVSGVDAGSIKGTQLHMNITAHNSCTFVWGNYATSSFHQAQKIGIIANKNDMNGDSYGEVSGANNAYVFGPQGKIVTTQPYIQRNIKTANDVEYSQTEMGTNMGINVSSTAVQWRDGSILNTDYQHYLHVMKDVNRNMASAWTFRNASRQSWTECYMMFGGAYNTSAELGFGDNVQGLNQLILVVNSACSNLRNTYYRYRWCVPLPLYSDDVAWVVEADKLAVNPYYQEGRHDYS